MFLCHNKFTPSVHSPETALNHCRPLLMLFLAFSLAACSGIPTNTTSTETATFAASATFLPTASSTPRPPTRTSEPLVAISTSSITPTQSVIRFFEVIAPGEYLLFTEKRGFGIASFPGVKHYLLAPIIDDWTMLSQDKKFIAYSTNGKPYLYNIGENQETKFDYPGGSCIAPDWSPDSHYIIYSCQQGPGYDLVVFSVADLTHQRLTDCAETTDFCGMPKWSPDGNRIAYMRKPAYSGGAEYTGLYILDTECFSRSNCGKGNGPLVNLYAYAWSPDGSLLAGVSNQGLAIYAYKDNDFILVDSIGEYGNPESIIWSPDGKFLAFGPVEGKAYIYSFENRELSELALPTDSRLRSWIRFP